MTHRYESLQASLQDRPRTWLITGVAGFIGSNLLEKLLQLDQRVVGLDNFATGHAHNLDEVRRIVGEQKWSRFQFWKGDITSESACQRACEGVEYVLHQAALGSVPRSIEKPLGTHAANVTGFVNMLVAAREAGVRRFVYASSSSVYGDHPGLPKVEEQIGKVLSPYAASKYADEIYADAFARCYHLSVIGLRYFNVFGPRQDPHGAYAAVIPKWIGKLLDGEACQIYGDGETSRDFTYIANVVQANLLSATVEPEPTSRVFNVACGESLTLTAIYQAIQDGLCQADPGFSPSEPVYEGFRRGDVRHSLADIHKAVSQLGYQPTHLVAQGLLETIRSYLQRSGRSGSPLLSQAS